jgi:predicted transcriptional regulator
MEKEMKRKVEELRRGILRTAGILESAVRECEGFADFLKGDEASIAEIKDGLRDLRRILNWRTANAMSELVDAILEFKEGEE